jgi:hypothetical protein
VRESPVLCPVCGWEYVHPVALKVEPVSGDTIVYINWEGLRTFATTAAERIRGIQITTTFLCEERILYLRSYAKPTGRGSRLTNSDYRLVAGARFRKGHGASGIWAQPHPPRPPLLPVVTSFGD